MTTYARHALIPAAGTPVPPIANLHNRTLPELLGLIREGLAGVDEGIDYCSGMWQYSTTLPEHRKPKGYPVITDATTLGELRYRWVMIYPVEGNSEGHYVHVDLLFQNVGPHGYDEARVPLFLVKTFSGQEAAITIASTLCRLLGV